MSHSELGKEGTRTCSRENERKNNRRVKMNLESSETDSKTDGTQRKKVRQTERKERNK